MAYPPGVLEATAEAVRVHGKTAAAEILGIADRTLRDRLAACRQIQAVQGGAVDGFEVARVSHQYDAEGNFKGASVTQRPERGPAFEIPPNTEFRGGTYQVGPDGSIERHWPRVKATVTDPDMMAAEIRAGLMDIRGAAARISPPKVTDCDLITAYFCADAHVGQLSWAPETGVNYDCKIAEEQLCAAFDECIERSPKSETAIIAILGDFTHANDPTNATPASKHVLDVDGRHRKTARLASRILRYKIDMARKKHKQVIFRYIPGNHDPDAAGWITDGLALLYENEPRVTIDADPGPHFFYEFGKTLICGSHGHLVPAKKLHEIACTHKFEMWGRTVHRYGHTGHRHIREKLLGANFAGMYVETHQAVTASDKYAHGNFPLSGRSMTAVTYSRSAGEYLRITVPIKEVEFA